MAHFAHLDENDVVINIVVVDNNDLLDENGNEVEALGIQYLKNIFGENSKWVQTSYNNNFRKRYAGIGDYYDRQRDIFVQPKLWPSCIFDEELQIWVPPIPQPVDGRRYMWNEEDQRWDLDPRELPDFVPNP